MRASLIAGERLQQGTSRAHRDGTRIRAIAKSAWGAAPRGPFASLRVLLAPARLSVFKVDAWRIRTDAIYPGRVGNRGGVLLGDRCRTASPLFPLGDACRPAPLGVRRTGYHSLAAAGKRAMGASDRRASGASAKHWR